jgi:glucosamine 6-phosphate synthetase-like amidotransferase/phosphosugar isomerase protein
MAGELKHGPLALVDVDMPMIMIITRDPTYAVKHFFKSFVMQFNN